MSRDNQLEPTPMLGQISTHWTALNEPVKFVMTYGTAIRKYLLALLRHEHDADEVLQDLLLQMTAKGFAGATPDRGRFRDYLKAVVRNAARKRLRQKPLDRVGDVDAEQPDAADRAWVEQWRQCVLDKAWRGLEHRQRATKGNLSYLVLKLAVDHPDDDSRRLAVRASTQSGQALTPEAFRKQLSRARQSFAELILDEVRQTLDSPTPEQIQEELADLNLLEHLRDYLPGGS